MVTCVPVHAEEDNVFSAKDENILYIGRWIENEKGYMEGSFECSLTVKFTGTSIELNKGSSGKMHYRIDGGEAKAYSTRKLASNLSSGEHTLEIFAYAQQAFPVISGFILDSGEKLIKPEDKPVVEFIGDSIMEGYIVNSDKKSNNSVLNSYGHKTADLLGFYRNIVAFGGITVSQGYGSPDTQGMINRYKMVREYTPDEAVSPAWDLTAFVPDYVVINLGTNDGRASDGEFKMWYTSFLSLLRQSYKDAKIFMMTPFNGRHRDNIIAVHEGFNDENVYLIDSYLWNIPGGGDNLHPDGSGHDLAAEKLSEEITKLLSATPEPSPTPVVTEGPQPNGDGKKGISGAIIGAAAVAVGAVGAGAAVVINKKKKNKEE